MEFYLFYEALICFLDVTLLNLFPSQNRLLVVPVRGKRKISLHSEDSAGHSRLIGVTNFHKS